MTKLWNITVKDAPVTSCNLLEGLWKGQKNVVPFQCASQWSKLSFEQQSPTACVIHNILTSHLKKENLYWLLCSRQALALKHGMLAFILLCAHSRCRHHVEQQNETCFVLITAVVLSNPGVKRSFAESQLFSQGLGNERQKSHGERCQW